MQVVRLANSLDKDKFERHVIVFWDQLNGFKELLDHRIIYHSLQFRRRAFLVGFIKFLSYLKTNAFDVLHSHMYEPNKYGALFAKLARIPVVITGERGKNPWKTMRHHLVEKHIISKLADKRVAVSHDIRNLRILQDGVRPDKIVTIPNGVNLPSYQTNTGKKPRIFGTLGRLVDAKDYPTLILAAKKIKEFGFDFELRIAGEGHLKTALANLIQQTEMTDSVKLVGMQKADPFLKNLDIFVMSSKREGMPGALLEAMSYGLPIAATNAGGIKEVIKDGKDGLLAEVGDIDAIAAHIVELIQNKQLRGKIGKNARQKIMHNYSMEIIAKRYEDLYFSMLKKKGIVFDS